jgi:predicted transcriptional regulator
MAALGYTVADLRNPERVAEINAKAKELKAAATKTRTGTTIRQPDVARALATFPYFAEAEIDGVPGIGPKVDEVHAVLVEGGAEVKRPAVNMHLNKLRRCGVIGNAADPAQRKGKGRPPVFYFLLDADAFERVLGGETIREED